MGKSSEVTVKIESAVITKVEELVDSINTKLTVLCPDKIKERLSALVKDMYNAKLKYDNEFQRICDEIGELINEERLWYMD